MNIHIPNNFIECIPYSMKVFSPSLHPRIKKKYPVNSLFCPEPFHFIFICLRRVTLQQYPDFQGALHLNTYRNIKTFFTPLIFSGTMPYPWYPNGASILSPIKCSGKIVGGRILNSETILRDQRLDIFATSRDFATSGNQDDPRAVRYSVTGPKCIWKPPLIGSLIS